MPTNSESLLFQSNSWNLKKKETLVIKIGFEKN